MIRSGLCLRASSRTSALDLRLLGGESRERFEQFCLLPGRDPDAGIGDRRPHPPSSRDLERNGDAAAWAVVLDRV